MSQNIFDTEATLSLLLRIFILITFNSFQGKHFLPPFQCLVCIHISDTNFIRARSRTQIRVGGGKFSPYASMAVSSFHKSAFHIKVITDIFSKIAHTIRVSNICKVYQKSSHVKIMFGKKHGKLGKLNRTFFFYKI